MKQYECLGNDIPNAKNDITHRKFGALGLFSHNLLFMEWSHSAIDNEKPQVSFPEECLVKKYARPVLYFVSGWVLHSASKALTVAVSKQAKYLAFVRARSLGKEGATEAGLPVSLIKRRKRKSKVYCTKDLF